MDQQRRTAARPDETLSYGQDARQRILFFAPKAGRTARGARPPLAVYVHGGGWAKGAPELLDSKPAWFTGEGWAFASVGYRLLPEAPVESQAADVGAALRQLRREASRLGYDPDRILLFGHSAGAHLAALVSTDPRYAGDAFSAIRGTILIDGAAYDVAAQMQKGKFMARRTYIPAFGTDPARQRELSPIAHVGAPDVPQWLLLYADVRSDAQAQSTALADALRAKGASAQLLPLAMEGNALKAHMEINRQFGTPGYGGNDAVRALMARIAAR